MAALSDDRWKRTESVFLAALEVPPERRADYVRSACEDDREIADSVLSLLAHHERPDLLLDSTRTQAVPSFLETEGRLLPGDRIADYELIRFLGRGGMGEVYLARHLSLGRLAAIKVLSEELSSDAGLIHRLRREAETASSLNHPNLVTIFAFGEERGRHYIAMEYVEGAGLRSLIGKLQFADALRYGTQLAQALAAAHGAGVIHRDIKPENIIARPDGYIKVLDFGIAKAVAPVGNSGNSMDAHTMPGTLLGTPLYMSPEQIRGQPPDHRTDLWSWGVVFHEMIFGQRPFGGETPGDLLANMLQSPPVYKGKAGKILGKALKAVPAARYQRASDIVADLARLRPGRDGDIAAMAPRGASEKWSERFGWRGAVFACVTVLGCAGVFAAARILRSSDADAVYQIDDVSRLTASGNVTQAAISRDHKYVAYSMGGADRQSLRLRELGTNADLERLPEMDGAVIGISFDPSDKYIFFVLLKDGMGSLYKMPALAGAPVPIVRDVDTPISFAPDGRQFAFERWDTEHGRDYLEIYDEASQSIRVRTTIYAPNYFRSPPAWSPDGSSIVCGVVSQGIAHAPIQIMSVPMPAGTPAFSAAGDWWAMYRPVWLDPAPRRWGVASLLTRLGLGLTRLRWGSSPSRARLRAAPILVAARTIESNDSQVFEIDAQSGRKSQLTHDLTSYMDLDRDGEAANLVGVRQDLPANIAIVDRNGESRQLFPAPGRLFGLTWANGGRLISQTEFGGKPDLWSFDAVTGNRQPLTDTPWLKFDPVAVPNGKYLVFADKRTGRSQIWRSDQQGLNAVRLTYSDAEEYYPSLSWDEKWVAYTSLRDGKTELWRVPVEGGVPSRISSESAHTPVISPNGQWIACQYQGLRDGTTVVALLRWSDGSVYRLLPNVPVEQPIQWSGDGKSILYSAQASGASNIFLQSIAGGKGRQLTKFREGSILAFSVSRDGQVACLRATLTSDVVLLRGKWSR